MDILCLPLFTRLAILALLLAPSSAQDKVTIPDTDSCRVDFDVNAPVNATGSLNIHWNALMMDPTRNDWTLSLTYNDTRGQNGTLHQWDSYLSAPEGNEAKACVFMFAGLNKTSSSDQHSGCNGVIDEACVTVLREFNNIQGGCTWPAPLDEFTDRVRQACGTNFLSTGPQTYPPIDFGNSTTHCSHSHPPEGTPQESYRTVQAASVTIDGTDHHSDRNISDYKWYDIYAKQTIPIVIAAEFFGGVGETQVICLAPNEIVEGSRTPMQRSGAIAQRQSSSVLSLYIMLAIAIFMHPI